MGNAQVSEQSDQGLSEPLIQDLISQYRTLKGELNDTVLFRWDNDELQYLFELFWSQVRLSESLDKKDDKKKDKKNRKKTIALDSLKISRQFAIQHIEVYNQPFSNYPKLFSRFWSIVDPRITNYCTFVAFSDLLYVVVRGNWDEKIEHVFRLLNDKPQTHISRACVEAFVNEVGEFFSNIARGLITVQDFGLLKCSSIGTMFENNEVLNFDNFKLIALRHQDVISCALITDMIFGRYYRKLLKAIVKNSPRRSFVFGHTIAEGSLGNGRDITGKHPFIPEILATAFEYLERNQVHQNPELFQKSVNLNQELRKKFDQEGKYLFKLLQHTPPSASLFLEVGTYIKLYFQNLPSGESLWGTSGGTVLDIYKLQGISEDHKLIRFVQVFNQLPPPNRFVISALLRFLNLVLTEREILQPQNPDLSFIGSFARSTFRQMHNANYSEAEQAAAFKILVKHADRFVVGEHRVEIATPRVRRANADPLQALEDEIAQVQQQIADLKRRLHRE